MRKATSKIPEFNSPDEEREYWEARGPLAKGRIAEHSQPSQNKRRRSSFLSVRLSGEELTAWRDLAARSGMGPSRMAQELILAYLKQANRLYEERAKDKRAAVSLEEASKSLASTLPSSFSDKIDTLMKSSLLGDTSDPKGLVMGTQQFHEYLRISALVVARLYEMMNPDTEVVVPPEVMSLLSPSDANTPEKVSADPINKKPIVEAATS